MARQGVEVVGLRGIPGVMGGVEAHCAELIPRIAALAPDLDIEVVGRIPYIPPGETVYRGVRIKPLPAPRQPQLEAIVSTLRGVVRARRRGAALVHFHGIGPALLVPLARLLGMRALVTHHSLNYDHQKWSRFARIMLRLGEQLAVRFADRVIVVAPWLGARLRAQYPARAAKVVVIQNGQGSFPDEADATVMAELGLRSGEYILAVGRMVPEKAFDLLIAAFEKSGTSRRLLLVGGADHASDYARALLAKASDQIIFAGVRQRPALKALYEGAALFVLPSTHEGMPIAALEAVSLGCPILLSDIEPNRDMGFPAVNYFPCGNADALAARLSQSPADLVVDRAMIAMADWDKAAADTLAIYRLALARLPLLSMVAK